jgi:hypothetical protein
MNLLLERSHTRPFFFFSFFFPPMGWDLRHQVLRPLLAYCIAPDDWWGWLWSNWRNEDWQGKPKYSENTCPSAILSTTNPTWPDPGSNPGRRGGKPATNRLSYGAAYTTFSYHIYYIFFPREMILVYPLPLPPISQLKWLLIVSQSVFLLKRKKPQCDCDWFVYVNVSPSLPSYDWDISLKHT